MGRTILEIAQEAAERDATAPAPARLFGTNDRIARILRAAAKDTVREYLRTSGWQGFSELHSTWVFSLRAGRYAYSLPPDFLRIIPSTEQRNGWPLGLVGPASPQSWAAWLYGGAAVSAPMGWRIKNNALWIEPTPTTDELVVIEYISRYHVLSDVKDGDIDFNAQPPQAVAPFVTRDGHLDLPNDDLLIGQSIDQSGTYGSSPGYDDGVWPTDPYEVLRRLHPGSTTDPKPEMRRPELTADDDRLAFDDDYVVSLGMTFRLRRALGMPFAEHAAEYEEEMAIKGATDGGSPRGFRLGSDEGCEGMQTPLGGGRWLID
jgi:hypothetical protein